MGKLQRLAINEEGFIFDPETGDSYTTNSTGLFIIKRLREGKSENEIIQELIEAFEIDEEEARKDLTDFTEQLRIMGLVEGENG